MYLWSQQGSGIRKLNQVFYFVKYFLNDTKGGLEAFLFFAYIGLNCLQIPFAPLPKDLR
jgi:hypothetical protein